MAQPIFEENLVRIVGQIEFRPTISTLNGTQQIATELEEQFEEWRAEKPNDIALYSPTEKKFLQIASNVSTYVNEGEQDVEELHKLLSKVMKDNIEKFSITQIRRIGFRVTRVMKTKFNFSDLVDLTYKKFYSSAKELKEISTTTPRDVVFVLDGEKNGFLNHVQMGPVKKEESVKGFAPHFPLKKDSIDDVNFFVDVDVFVTKDIKTTETVELLQKAIDENYRITKEYFSYLSI